MKPDVFSFLEDQNGKRLSTLLARHREESRRGDMRDASRLAAAQRRRDRRNARRLREQAAGGWDRR